MIMFTRRAFLGAAAAATALFKQIKLAAAAESRSLPSGKPPVAVSSANGLRAVARAAERMRAGSDPLDAIVEGVNLIEDDPDDMTVGLGGIPNEDGVVQLDASVMHGPTARAGAVASLEGIKNPSRVAKLIMETT